MLSVQFLTFVSHRVGQAEVHYKATQSHTSTRTYHRVTQSHVRTRLALLKWKRGLDCDSDDFGTDDGESDSGSDEEDFFGVVFAG